MKDVKILWLYQDLMDLYGDRGNILALKYQLDTLKVNYIIENKSLGDTLDFAGFDLVYVGPGKDKNAVKAAEHLAKYKEQLSSAIENGTTFLVTGNAQVLFGKEIEDEKGNVYPAADIFEYRSKLTGEVFLNDYTARPYFNEQALSYGLINRTSYLENVTEEPLFKVEFSQKDIGATEGILYKNFFATWALGPVLAKNPHILLEILNRILDVKIIGIDDGLQNIALQRTLGELEK